MTRTILTGLLAVACVATLGLLPTACSSSGIGDPCVPEDEYNGQFSGFKVTEDNIESRSFQCESRICLVNHFQGRVSCPLGQPAPATCTGPNDTSCAEGTCTEAATYAPYCDTDPADTANKCVQPLQCVIVNKDNKDTTAQQGNYCSCSADTDCPQTDGQTFICDKTAHQCKTYVCHKAGVSNCQDQNATATANAGKSCCIPGTDSPVAGPVCGQCDDKKKRDAAGSVYCSCRCGVADGQPAEPGFNFCTCPTGFECSQIRAFLGPQISDPQLAGKYCIKTGSATTAGTAAASCGNIAGEYETGNSTNTIHCDGLKDSL